MRAMWLILPLLSAGCLTGARKPPGDMVFNLASPPPTGVPAIEGKPTRAMVGGWSYSPKRVERAAVAALQRKVWHDDGKAVFVTASHGDCYNTTVWIWTAILLGGIPIPVPNCTGWAEGVPVPTDPAPGH